MGSGRRLPVLQALLCSASAAAAAFAVATARNRRQVLKIVRYTSRLVAALSPPGSHARARFEALQSSVGTSRKAYRLGKFLQDVNGLRRVKVRGLEACTASRCSRRRLAVPQQHGRTRPTARCCMPAACCALPPKVAGNPLAALEAVAYVGEGVYYFLDQVTW